MYDYKMETWLQQILMSVIHNPSYYFLIAAIACGEGIAFIGLVIPGSVLCISIGVLAANGHGNFWLSCFAAGMGSIIGDLLSYLIGSRGGHHLINRLHSPRTLKLIRRAELFFAAHGGKSLLLARFFGPLRGFVPFIAGALRTSPRDILLYSVCGGMIWGVSYPALGYYGGLTWQRFQFSANTVIAIISLIAVGIFAVWFLRRNKKGKEG